MMDEKAVIQKAEDLYNEGKIEEAIFLFKTVIEENPGSYIAYNNMGVIYHDQGEIINAENSFRKALSIKEDYQDALLNISDYYQNQKNLEKATEYLEKAVNNDDKDFIICNRLATLYLETGNKEKACNIIKRSLCINPDQASIKGILALLESNNALLQTDDKGIKILHVMILDKFLPPFIDFVDKNFGRNDHHYVFVEAERYDYGLTPEHKVEFFSSIDNIFITLKDYMYEAEKIIIHGLWRNEILILLYYNQELLKKCYWAMWGGDYYFPERQPQIKKEIIKNMGQVINATIGDYELIKKWYGTRAKRHKCFGYLSNTFKDYSYLEDNISKKNNKKVVLIGNSADPSNNHFDILKKIVELANDKIKIICPLSYGDMAYANKVIQAGKTVFGGQFKPLTEFIPPEEYLKILFKVDIAIFAHNRQQGMGNIRTLLGMGKKVYMRDDVTSWQALRDIGIKVYSFNNENIDFDFPEHIKNENINKMKENFSYEQLIYDWKKIFDD